MLFARVSLSLAAFGLAFGAGPAMPQTDKSQTDQAAAAIIDTERAIFPICSRAKRITCVVDGDTIWYRGTKIRIADIDTPEVSRPGCAREAAIGRRATERMQTLLNAGAFTLKPSADGRETDHFGRALRVVTRGGVSLGDVMVEEGLAEVWGGDRVAWC